MLRERCVAHGRLGSIFPALLPAAASAPKAAQGTRQQAGPLGWLCVGLAPAMSDSDGGIHSDGACVLCCGLSLHDILPSFMESRHLNPKLCQSASSVSALAGSSHWQVVHSVWGQWGLRARHTGPIALERAEVVLHSPKLVIRLLLLACRATRRLLQPMEPLLSVKLCTCNAA